MEKRIHNGRLRDSFQIPHKNRKRYLVKFFFADGTHAGSVVAVSDTDTEAKLQKYKDEVIAANPGWIRPKQRRVYEGMKNGQACYKYMNVTHQGRQVMTNYLRKVTAEFLGADI